MRRHPLLILSIVGLLAVLVLGAFPVRAYYAQVAERRQLAAQARTLAHHNQTLTDQVKRLQDPAVVEQLARERYLLVKPGEEAYALLPEASAAAPAPATADAAGASGSATRKPAQGWLARTWSRVTSIF